MFRCAFAVLALAAAVPCLSAPLQMYYMVMYAPSRTCVTSPGTLPMYHDLPQAPSGQCFSTLEGDYQHVHGPNGKSIGFRSIKFDCLTNTLTGYSENACNVTTSTIVTIPPYKGSFRDYCIVTGDNLNSMRLFCPEPLRSPPCAPKAGTNRKQCEKKIKLCGRDAYTGLKWVGAGCKKKGKKIQKAGCQCRDYCGYKCQAKCTADQDCAWNSGINACVHKANPTVAASEVCSDPPIVGA